VGGLPGERVEVVCQRDNCSLFWWWWQPDVSPAGGASPHLVEALALWTAFGQSQVEAKRGLPPPTVERQGGTPRACKSAPPPSQAARLLWHQRPARQASLRKTPSAWVRGLTASSLCEFFLRSALPVLSCSPRICSTEAAQLADRRTPQPSCIAILPARRQTHFCLCFTIL